MDKNSLLVTWLGKLVSIIDKFSIEQDKAISRQEYEYKEVKKQLNGLRPLNLSVRTSFRNVLKPFNTSNTDFHYSFENKILKMETELAYKKKSHHQYRKYMHFGNSTCNRKYLLHFDKRKLLKSSQNVNIEMNYNLSPEMEEMKYFVYSTSFGRNFNIGKISPVKSPRSWRLAEY